MTAARECSEVNLQLMDVTLEVEHARAYWAHTGSEAPAGADQVFSEYWFGARSLPRTRVLLRAMRARFNAFPAALGVLRRWDGMGADTRRCVCHWHVQLADPLYRRFTGAFLVARRAALRPTVTRDAVLTWLSGELADRWTTATRIQLASKLLSTSRAAGLVESTRDPRPLAVPRVPDEALVYMLHLLRGISFEGTLLANPYLASVGLEGAALDERLRRHPDLQFRRQAELIDFGWQHADLAQWAAAKLHSPALEEQRS